MSRAVLAWIAVFALMAALGLSFLQILEYQPRSSFTRPIQEAKEFEGQIHIRIDTYQPSRQCLTATVTLTVKATREDQQVDLIALSLERDLSDDSYRLMYFDEDSPEFTRFERTREGQLGLFDTVEVVQTISVPLSVRRHPLFYPFDQYRMAFDLHGCVNEDLGCVQTDNLALSTLVVEYSALQVDANLVVGPPTVTDDRYEFSILRAGFLRLTTVILFVIALVFFWVLTVYFKKDDVFKGALGYLGALWGLRSILVPRSVTTFPTLVDYTVLTLFCVLFVALLARYLILKED